MLDCPKKKIVLVGKENLDLVSLKIVKECHDDRVIRVTSVNSTDFLLIGISKVKRYRHHEKKV